jgi:hypothetical protein
MVSIQCNKCNATVLHDPKQLTGCLCDPDAPTWCWIEADGRVRGFSHSKYNVLEDKE